MGGTRFSVLFGEMPCSMFRCRSMVSILSRHTRATKKHTNYVTFNLSNHLSYVTIITKTLKLQLGVKMEQNWQDKVISKGGALIGYGRVSSRSQNLTIQIDALTGAGVKKPQLYVEKVSGSKREGREQLNAMLERGLRKHDCLVITRLDRLARSTRDLLRISDILDEKGVNLVCLEQSVNTTTPEGRLFFTLLGAFGEFETTIRAARQREGIDAALAKGPDSPFRGRPATIDVDIVKALKADGMGATAISRELRITRQSVYRILKGVAKPSK